MEMEILPGHPQMGALHKYSYILRWSESEQESHWPLPHPNAYFTSCPAPAPAIGLSGAIHCSGVKDSI